MFRADLKTGEALKISGELVSGGAVNGSFASDPRGRYLISFGDQLVDGELSLFHCDFATGECTDVAGPFVANGDVYID